MALPVPQLTPGMPFDDACAAVVAYLKDAVPMGFWSVTRYDGDKQVYLSVRDDTYGKVAGDFHAWSDSLCQFVVAGDGPQIAPDAMAVSQYATAGVARRLPIGSYVGIPIARATGELFGTICGLDPAVQTRSLEEHRPILTLLSTLLGTILEADLERAEHARELDEALMLSETDALTGLVNRRGWDRAVALEDDRWRRYGDPGAVVAVDLDGLKEINDRLGHAAGDRTLARAAEVLRGAARAGDVVARLGGDEFGVLAMRTTAVEAVGLEGRLAAALEGAGIAASVGRSDFAQAHGPVAACAAADAAMYARKRVRGRTA